MCWPKRGQNWKDKKNKTNSRVDKLQFGFVGKKDQYWKDEEKRTNIEKMKERANIEKMKERRRKKFPQRQIASKRSTPGLFQCQRVVPTCVVRPFYKSRYFCRNICLHFWSFSPLNLKSDGGGFSTSPGPYLSLICVWLDRCLSWYVFERYMFGSLNSPRAEAAQHGIICLCFPLEREGKQKWKTKKFIGIKCHMDYVKCSLWGGKIFSLGTYSRAQKDDGLWGGGGHL